jgi:peptide/nickel transport system substrate-binding protein
LLARLSSVLLVLVLLGCTLQTAPSPPVAAPPSAPVSPTDPVVPADESVTTAPSGVEGDSSTAQPDSASWTIALQDEPGNLLPFSPDGRAAAPIVQALFPPPVLEHSYTYTTTGVLASLPTLDNGDVQINEIAGFLDATGQFTITETTQPTTTEQLVVTFRWNPDLRWADGTPLTAADSVFTYELLDQVQEPAEAAAIREMLERYEQVDSWTTRAVFKPGRVEPSYLRAAWPPLPRHLVADLPPEQALDDLQQAPVGYGPYTFESLAPGQLSLRRNDSWPSGDGLPEQLIFRFYASAEEVRGAVVSGDADVGVIERVPAELYRFLDQDQANQAAGIAYVAGPVYEHLDLNLGDDRFRDQPAADQRRPFWRQGVAAPELDSAGAARVLCR